MRLILSSPHPRNSTYSTEAGEILYKVDKPLKLGSSIATIRKAVGTINGVWQGDSGKLTSGAETPTKRSEGGKVLMFDNSRHRPASPDDRTFAGSEPEGDAEPGWSSLPVLEGHFAFYAQIEFHTFESTRFRYDGLDVPVSKYFRKEGQSWFESGRVFKASDGKEYRWRMHTYDIDMIINDSSKTPMVRFKEYRPELRPLWKSKPAILEIDPCCEPILDEIIMTFIYCHKLRKDREGGSEGRLGGSP